MSDLVRTIIKWALIVVLAILVFLLIRGIVTRNSKNAKQKEPIRSIETIKLDDDDDDEEESKTSKEKDGKGESTLVVNLGDTASTRGISVWIGVIILGTTTYYVYKSRQVNE